MRVEIEQASRAERAFDTTVAARQGHLDVFATGAGEAREPPRAVRRGALGARGRPRFPMNLDGV